MSFSECGSAGEETFHGRTGLQFCNQYSCAELYLAPCDRKQFLELGQRAEDLYDLFADVLVSRVGMAEDDDSTCLDGKLSAQSSKLRTGGRHVQTYAMPSMMVLPETGGAKSAAERRVVEDGAGSGSSSSSPSERSAK